MAMVASKRDETVIEAELDATEALNESVLGALESCAEEEGGSEAGAAGAEGDAGWARRLGARLGARLAALDAANVGAMLAAATDGGGARLAARLDHAASHAAALNRRLANYEGTCRAAADCGGRAGAALAEAAARALLEELQQLYATLDPPALRDLDDLAELNLSTPAGRQRCAAAASALHAATSAPLAPHLARLAAVRARLKRLARAKEQLCACIARHVNNAVIHAGNMDDGGGQGGAHAALRPLAPLCAALRRLDNSALQAVCRLYCSTWSAIYARRVSAACDAVRAAPAADVHTAFSDLLRMVEEMCNSEQDFCTAFFHLELEEKGGGGGGGGGSDAESGGGSGGSGGAARTAGAAGGEEARALQKALFPSLAQELLSVLAHIDKLPYGCFRALACVSDRVLSAGGAVGGAVGGAASGAGGAGGAGRWATGALAAAAVAAKRAADKQLAERVAALPAAVKQAARKPKCGVFSFVRELEEFSQALEPVFVSRRAELERWYSTLTEAMMDTLSRASHPRTPPLVMQLENYHALYAVVSSLRVAALETARRECRRRYQAALDAYVTQYSAAPLDKLMHFFDGVSEAVQSGVPKDEVCYRAAFSKHELRRLLNMYPPAEVRKSLGRLYRTVERHVSADSGLLQVVWRHMQLQLCRHHQLLQERISTCYPGAGLSLPLTTQDILDAFSDIAREH